LDAGHTEETESLEEAHWAAELPPRIKPIVAAERQRFLAGIRHQPIAERQLLMFSGGELIKDLFSALHSSAWMSERDGKLPQCFWRHERVDLFHGERKDRRFDIDREELLRLAARYLSTPEIRTNRLDWVFLDAVVFQEFEAYAIKVFNSRGATGSGVNVAAAVARNEVQYMCMKPVFWVVRMALMWAAPLALIYYLYIHSHSIAAAVIGAWLIFGAVWELATWPQRIRARRKSRKLLQYLAELYAVLGQDTIPPTRWKQTLEAATTEGVILDGAVFTIIDRAIARDPTAFFPHG
jgi:hypothetical protein